VFLLQRVDAAGEHNWQPGQIAFVCQQTGVRSRPVSVQRTL